jgi:hypothetical protein
MGSSKKKTTFTKLAREGKLRERRLEKQAKKDARRRASGNQPASPGDALVGGERSGAHPVGRS